MKLWYEYFLEFKKGNAIPLNSNILLHLRLFSVWNPELKRLNASSGWRSFGKHFQWTQCEWEQTRALTDWLITSAGWLAGWQSGWQVQNSTNYNFHSIFKWTLNGFYCLIKSTALGFPFAFFSFPMSSNRFLVLQRRTISEYSYLLESLFNSERESITNADSCCRFSVFPFRIRTFDAVSEGTHFEVAEAEGKPSSGASSLILVISCRHQDTSSHPQTGWWCRLKPRRVSLQCVAFVWGLRKLFVVVLQEIDGRSVGWKFFLSFPVWCSNVNWISWTEGRDEC